MFMSPDPFVQNATSTQNFNRYSYCLGNPLKYTDLSGYTYGPTSIDKDGGGSGGGGGSWGSYNLDGDLSGNPFNSSGVPQTKHYGIYRPGSQSTPGSMGYKYIQGSSYMDLATGNLVNFYTINTKFVVPNAVYHEYRVNLYVQVGGGEWIYKGEGYVKGPGRASANEAAQEAQTKVKYGYDGSYYFDAMVTNSVSNGIVKFQIPILGYSYNNVKNKKIGPSATYTAVDLRYLEIRGYPGYSLQEGIMTGEDASLRVLVPLKRIDIRAGFIDFRVSMDIDAVYKNQFELGIRFQYKGVLNFPHCIKLGGEINTGFRMPLLEYARVLENLPPLP